MEPGIWIIIILANLLMIGQAVYFYKKERYANAVFAIIALIIFWIAFIYGRGTTNGTM